MGIGDGSNETSARSDGDSGGSGGDPDERGEEESEGDGRQFPSGCKVRDSLPHAAFNEYAAKSCTRADNQYDHSERSERIFAHFQDRFASEGAADGEKGVEHTDQNGDDRVTNNS